MAKPRVSTNTAPAIPGLWDFACETYARPGIREICLDWQTRYDADIPLVLALCWQAARGSHAPDTRGLEDLRRALEPWRKGTVLPLRALRERLKPLSPAHSQTARLRTAILTAELAAERVQLEYLARMLPDTGRRTQGAAQATTLAHQALDTYLTLLGVSPEDRHLGIGAWGKAMGGTPSPPGS
jgi:uncharacterized protein (TIGR02444 family)